MKANPRNIHPHNKHTHYFTRSISAPLKLIHNSPVTLATIASLWTTTIIYCKTTKQKTKKSRNKVYGLVPSSTFIFTGDSSVVRDVAGVVWDEFGDRLDCSFNVVMTPLFNLSTALLGSHLSPSTALVTLLAARMPPFGAGTVGDEVEDSRLGFPSVVTGARSPSFCLT